MVGVLSMKQHGASVASATLPHVIVTLMAHVCAVRR